MSTDAAGSVPVEVRFKIALHSWWTMGVLSLIYVISYIDRQSLTLVLDPIRQQLHISDTQVSLLTGLAFSILYSVFTIPLATLADRWSRKAVIFIGVVIWGLMTCACGVAHTFTTLFMARAGVGLGEAALTANGYALAAELFPGAQKSWAIAVFVLGGGVGSGLSLVIGGATVQWAGPSGWRLVFIALGVITVIASLLVLTIRSPKPVRFPSLNWRSPLERIVRHKAAFVAHFVAVPLLNLGGVGAIMWAPTLLMRTYHWDARQVGAILGSAGVGAALLAPIVAGALSTVGRKYWLDASMRILASVTVLQGLALCSLLATRSGNAAVTAMAVSMFLAAIGGPLAIAALQDVIPDGMRAQVSAYFLLVANLVGIGLGPTAVALFNDRVFSSPLLIGHSIAYVGAFATWLAALLIFSTRSAYLRLVLAHSETPANAGLAT